MDINWSTRRVGVIFSQKDGRKEHVVAYASKGLSSMHKNFHMMERKCNALIWGIMHFRQYLYMNHFTLRTNHKPLKWLATMSNAYGKQGKWIDMLQDFDFKIITEQMLNMVMLMH